MFTHKPAARSGPANTAGRWPANLVHDGSADVLAGFPTDAGARAKVRGTEPSAPSSNGVYNPRSRQECAFHGDSGSAARFFYAAKASVADREDGLEAFQAKQYGMSNGSLGAIARGDEYDKSGSGMNRTKLRKNTHPTVKPTELMRWLCRLVTPPGGHVLDPFAGSGSTGRAAMLEGLRFTGIEMDEGYTHIARARIAAALARTEDLA